MRLLSASDQGVKFIDVEGPPGYANARVCLKGVPEFVSAPLFSSEWLTTFLGQAKVNQESGTGMIIGITRHEPYFVKIDNGSSATGDINYFNKRGEQVFRGESNSGFIITNVVPGLHTLVLGALDEAEGLATYVIDVEPNYHSTLIHSF